LSGLLLVSADQTYYLTVALINLVLAFAGTRIKDVKGNIQSTPFLIGSFFAFSISWALYSLELTVLVEIISTLLSTLFVWGITVFSFKRCELKTPWRLISFLCLLNIIVQMFFTLERNINYVMHTASLFIPIAFGASGYLFLNKKINRNSSDIVIAYSYFCISAVVIIRSILLETSPRIFYLTTASTQIIWPIFSVISGVFFLLSFTEEAQKKLKDESITDTLTGLFNRRMFDTEFTRILPSLSRGKHYGVLIYIDLDGFKPINDEYGHNIGDKVLMEFSARLNQSSRGEETIARIGGDEFALLVENAGPDKIIAYQNAQLLARRIQHLMDEPIHINGLILQISCSIGVHILTPHAKNTQQEIKTADAAMYQAKRSQHNNIVFSDNLNKHSSNIPKIGIIEIDNEHNEIDKLLRAMTEKEIELVNGFHLLIEAVEKHFQNEAQISKKLTLNFCKNHQLNHAELLQSLKQIDLNDREEIILENLSLFIKKLEQHVRKYDHALNLDLTHASTN